MTEIDQLDNRLLIIQFVKHDMQEDLKSLNVSAGLFLGYFLDRFTH